MSTKNIIIVCVTVLALGIIFFDQVKIRNLTRDKQVMSVQLMSVNDTAKAYRTKAGDAYFKLNSVLVENNAMKGSLEATGIDNKKLKAEKVDLGSVISVLKAQISTQGHTVIQTHDSTLIVQNSPSLSVKTFNWNNKFLFESGTIFDKRIEMDYTYKTDLVSTTEQVKKKSIVTISLSDPNARIISGGQIIVIPTEHWWNKTWVWGAAGFVTGYLIKK